MLNAGELDWLAAEHPGLLQTETGLAGTIKFTATYNVETNTFLILKPGVTNEVGGVQLTCEFAITIEPRRVKAHSSLPAVKVQGVEPLMDRHFGPADQTACLCSPFEERQFLEPRLQFPQFIDQLVIPFLYGQNFYTQFGRWPWSELAHGATGLLESFVDGDSEVALAHLAMTKEWVQIKAVLQQEQIKGHTRCFCSKEGHLRSCHPKALDGLLRLKQEVTRSNKSLP